MEKECLFCRKSDREFVVENEYCYAIKDKYPVQQGHTLIITKRHISSFFECTENEISSIYNLISKVKIKLDETLRPDGYNIGINIGEHGGQTINHVHVHLIPRYRNDVINPKGGIRNFIPNKVDYP